MGFFDFIGGKGTSFFDLTTGGILDDLMGRRNMREQNAYNLYTWNLQNEYNSPKAQMQRFAEAGLNPNLIYSRSNTASPVASSASAGGLSQAIGSGSKAFQTVMAFKSMLAQLKNMNEQNKNLQAQNSLISSQRSVADANARRINYETNWLQKHDTSSFDNSYLRGAKSLLDYAQPVADSIGRAVGSVVGSFQSSPRLVPMGDDWRSTRKRLNSWRIRDLRW